MCRDELLLVVICRDRSVVALRAQKPSSLSSLPSVGPLAPLCAVCGLPGRERCSRCHTVSYCGRTHQAFDWKRGHKATCGYVLSVCASLACVCVCVCVCLCVCVWMNWRADECEWSIGFTCA